MEYTYEFLKKCHGLRFRATICNKPQEGIIKVTSEGVILCYGQEDPGYLATFGRRDTLSFSKQTFAILPGDFEIVTRDPETYKDWQVGDRVCNPAEHWDIEAFKEVIFRSGELVVCKDKNRDIGGGYTCEQLHHLGYRLVLTDIEKQIIEEKKVVEDIPNKPKLVNYEFKKLVDYVFKKLDPVLVRNGMSDTWKPAVFKRYGDANECRYISMEGYGFSHCLPLNEDTESLIGTTSIYLEGRE